MDRRSFIKTAAAAGLGMGLAPLAAQAPVPRRPLGRTGQELSLIGFGGIVVMDKPQAQADQSVARAVARGINYFDVAPSYGNAEERLGPALQPHRQGVFLACKTTQRRAAGAREELHASLKRMRTDHFDLYQLHALTTLEEVETAFGPGGAMEAFLQARQAGEVRWLGFSAHSAAAATAAMERFAFDTLLFPINLPLWQAGFGPQVLARAREQGLGILALKGLCRGRWPDQAERTHPPCWYQPATDPEEARLALSFVFAQGATAAIPPGNEELFWMAVDLAAQFRPFGPAEEERLKELTAAAQPLFT
ncbi:MAG: aldo/keto reductase [Candidatus Latescibacteria bacterium]|nr:aldo/keto reductase [Candidatus Latescibacterota bacterium]